MKIILFGGSGFLGTHLIQKLAATGHQTTLVSRRPNSLVDAVPASVSVKSWFPLEGLSSIIDGSDAVVNLIGESIGAKRWNPARKQEILLSRVDTTRSIVNAIGKTSKKPSVLLNASAVGYYGDVPEGEVIETHPPGNDFLADVCARWEGEATKVEQFAVRVVMPRSGLVLSDDGGALPRMTLPFMFFAGGTLGSGKQWVPWIHIEDEVNALIYALGNTSLVGPVNFTAPEAVTMKQFCRAIGNAMHRPSLTPVPAFVLRTILGEMADALILGGQKAVPTKLMLSGFEFRHGRVDDALRSILRT